ncbi:MAG: hypothetical protein B6I19_09235 [Bacteroidetes bacterium 4572_114]|nr:MAG: hypothetical protein B6I19_09235 [Bacteroidetes bacterium 4572_114]
MKLDYTPYILIVDDNKENLLALNANLRNINAQILMAQNGKEAILHCRQKDFALIILDVQMPGINGFETAVTIRQGTLNKNTPIIFLTAVYFDQDNIDKGYKTGAVDYITKPFNREILLSKVKIFLDLDNVKRELIRSKINFENVVQDQTDMICRTDKDFHITFANRAFLLTFSTSFEHIRAKPIMANIDRNDREKINRALLLLTPNSPIIKLHHFINVSQSRRLFVSTVFRALYDEDYIHVGYQMVIRDVTRDVQIKDELLSAKKSAEETLKSMAMLLVNLGHDFRTPMNSIIGMADILIDSQIDQEQKDDVNVIKISAYKLLSILNTLVDFSKIEAKQIDFKNIWFDPQTELSNLIKLSVQKETEKRNKIILSGGKELPLKTNGDPKRINQILNPLLQCINHFIENGTIELSIKKENIDTNHIDLVYRISANGSSFPESVSSAITNYFDNGDPSFSHDNGGIALGLALSKSLSALMGGSVKFVDEPGKGFFFSFKIGLETEWQHPDNANNISILVVEDNILNQKVVGLTLKKKGLTYDLAGDGLLALEKYKKNRFDFILMDIQMPVMDGYETTKHIRNFEKENPNGKTAMIYALTANATNENQQKGLTAGMNGFMTKPFKYSELEKIIYTIPEEI